jgi:16S rRNA processing protein RimM
MGVLALGVVARPQGVVGELRVHLYNPDSTVLESAGVVHLRADGVLEERRVLAARRVPGKPALVMRLDRCATRAAAEGLRGAELCVPREALPALAEGEHYHVDLVGLEAHTVDGASIGRVVDVVTYPTVHCLVVRTEAGRLEVPMVEPYLVAVDVPAGVVRVSALEGLPVGPEAG